MTSDRKLEASREGSQPQTHLLLTRTVTACSGSWFMMWGHQQRLYEVERVAPQLLPRGLRQLGQRVQPWFGVESSKVLGFRVWDSGFMVKGVGFSV